MTNEELSNYLKEWWELYFHESSCSEKYLQETLEKHRQAYLKIQSLLEAQEPTILLSIDPEEGEKIKEKVRAFESGHKEPTDEERKGLLTTLTISKNLSRFKWTAEALKDFDKIRSLILAKPKVSRKFVEKWMKKITAYPSQHRVEEMLTEAGLEVEGR